MSYTSDKIAHQKRINYDRSRINLKRCAVNALLNWAMEVKNEQR